MSARRTVRLETFSLESPPSLDEAEAFLIADTGYIGAHIMVDDGAGGAPSGAASGVFALFVSGDGDHYVRCDDADPGLARTLLNGQTQLSTMVPLDATPSQYAKIVFEGNGGGEGDNPHSEARIFVTVG